MRSMRWLTAAMLCAIVATSVIDARAADLAAPTNFTPLVADRRGVRVGDIVTIVVVENSSATNSADLSSEKSYSAAAEFSTITPLRREGGQFSVRDGSDGQGRLQKSGRLVAQLSVQVHEVLPNGDLLVRGDQEINLNGEKTRISIEGALRPSDITGGNVALSTRLANARIEYIGDGYVSDRARPGLIARVLNWLGLW